MGKSVPPYSHVIDRLEAQYAPFRRALSREDKERLDRLFDCARQHTPGGVYQSDPEPFRTLVLGMLIELTRRIEALDPERRWQ